MHSHVDERTSLPFFLSSLTGALDARQTHTECNLCVHAAHHRVPPSVTGAMFTIPGCVLSPIEPFKSGRFSDKALEETAKKVDTTKIKYLKPTKSFTPRNLCLMDYIKNLMTTGPSYTPKTARYLKRAAPPPPSRPS
ncbi:hypothetical protein C8J57DRAFT_1719691 [Mycena rebaudengoi]|nr:hypothetical protein C8J57DRAFT_1719691 [Mycena rebaudengoi]